MFTPLDDRIGGGPDGRVAVISYGAWVRRFGASPSVIGRTIRIDQQPFSIIGVAPRSFFGLAPGLAPEITIPLTTLKTREALASHSTAWVHLMGRLRAGATLDAADAALQQRWPLVLDETAPPQMPSDRRARYLSRRTSLVTGVAGFSRVRNSFAEPLKLLFGLVTLLFVVACAGAANLLIARGVARRQELTVRIAIGAGPGRIIRQLLTEAIVWTSAGAALGVFFSAWAGNVLVAMLASREEPIVLDLSPNGRLLLFVLAMTVLGAALCAALPAVLATRFAASARAQALPASRLPRRPAGTLLVSLQVALTLLLLVGAALFVRSLQRVLSQDAGFDRARVLVVAVDPEAAGYEGERVARFNTDLLDRLSVLPGVESASLSQKPPLSDEDGAWTQSIAVEGAAPSPEESREVYFNAVSPGYFRTVGIPLLQGRDFARNDAASAPRVVAINQSLAQRFFPGANPIGQRIQMGRNGRERMLEIVAVVGDAKYRRLQDAVPSTAYVAALQQGIDSTLYAEIRPAGSIAAIVDAVRREVRAIDGRVPLRLETVTERIRASLVKERALALLASSLGVAALVLACAAVYGLLAYSVFRQTRAIGLRLSMTLIGIGAGVLASLTLGRSARALLYQVSPADPVSVAGASVVMIAVAALAALLPSLRASRLDPVAALKVE
jgi:predicted permease